ncbi:hypothetical protein F4781DRAFT_405745 [Annulohypoxylon bovei var. microspora]|nr:hypothetical protein F4781DRAFT_405745 [Annulohypoxylon bovei var. microspora]
MDPELDSGLFGIHLSDSEDSNNGSESAGGNPPKKQEASTPADRTAQSEEEFQAVRKEYRVKVENGEIWKTIKLPLGSEQILKADAQSLLHAVEELYFFKRYAEGAQFVKTVLGNGNDSDENMMSGLDDDTRKLLRYYESKCNQKAGGV